LHPGVYDYEVIHKLINKSSVLHVSFPPSHEPDADPFPAILPMIGTMGNFETPPPSLNEPMDCYLHGYVTSRMMRLAKTQVDPNTAGLPVSICATIVDGLVLALTPHHHSYNYRSAILHGYATPVTDVEEKLWAMQLITNGVVPQRWENSRVPPTNAEMTSTQILKVRVETASAKVRRGGPSDDRADVRNEQMRARVWAGVVPVWEMLGEPVPWEKEEKGVPEYVREFVEGENRGRAQLARDAAREEGGK